jgi:hypothetical protein
MSGKGNGFFAIYALLCPSPATVDSIQRTINV